MGLCNVMTGTGRFPMGNLVPSLTWSIIQVHTDSTSTFVHHPSGELTTEDFLFRGKPAEGHLFRDKSDNIDSDDGRLPGTIAEIKT